MLTLALTRPRLAWVERLTDERPKLRLGAERALTAFSLLMAGYAFFTVDGTLHKQLNHEYSALLRGAGFFLAAYAWLVHLEPFLREWKLRGWLGASVLYSGIATTLVMCGGVLAELALQTKMPRDALELTWLLPALIAACWVFYRILPTFNAGLEEAADWLFARCGW